MDVDGACDTLGVSDLNRDRAHTADGDFVSTTNCDVATGIVYLRKPRRWYATWRVQPELTVQVRAQGSEKQPRDSRSMESM
jgi:hypothetical protein